MGRVARGILLITSLLLLAPNCGTQAKLAAKIASREASSSDDVLQAAKTIASETGSSTDDVLRQWDDVGPQRPVGSPLIDDVLVRGRDTEDSLLRSVAKDSVCELAFDAIDSMQFPTTDEIFEVVISNAASSLSRSELESLGRDIASVFEEIEETADPEAAYARMVLLRIANCGG